MDGVLAGVLGVDRRNIVNIVYTEKEFFACLLVNGWVRSHDYNNSQKTYWDEVDAWLYKMWPEREHISGHTQWPMTFKIQFWNWGRKLFDTPILSAGVPLK